MNYYVPIQQNEACDKPTLSQPRYIPRILGRRYALTATAYKYLDIGIRVESMPCVELLIGDNRSRIGHLHLTYAIWKTFIERRADIVQLMQAAVPSSRISIHDLVIDLVNIRKENIVKLTLYNTSTYMKPSTIQFLLELEDCVEQVCYQLHQNIYIVGEKYKQFVTILRQNHVTNKSDAVKILHEKYDKTCLVDCELLAYASDNIV
ncbi:uncharacterized protein LOC118646076 [Monomorium pharaonis]|uniref:uncharacterized protein LOC118646076 n=1 Tax=Monomorium pharaonis TaxID=307658 RepID=UPI0017467D86|nr:uncharacterized protein LOC118646076 [Monomorium pharaonis]